MTKDILKGFLLLMGFGVTLASEESSSTLLISDYDASTMAEIQDVVITNQDVTDGSVLEVKQTLIARDLEDTEFPYHSVVIKGSGTINIGDINTTGLLSISNKPTTSSEAAVTNVRVSVTPGSESQVDVYIGRANDFDNSSSSTIVNAALDLSKLQQDVSFTVEQATISASQINQPTGSIHLVNHAGISLVAPSQLNNLYVDSTSNFFGDDLSPQVRVSGNNAVEVAPSLNGAGIPSKPASNGETIGCYQLYGLTFDKGSTLSLDMNNVNLADDILKAGGKFRLYFNGVNWENLDELTGRKIITDIDLLNSTFDLYNFKEVYGADFADSLLITGAYYSDVSTGLVLNISILPIPEPATATLSILALAGLVARRRRK